MADKREIDSKIKKVAENHRQITTSLSTITEGAQALLKGMSVELGTEEIVVPEGVYHIPDNSFLFLSSTGNYELERVVFPTTLLSVGKNLFGLFGASPGAFFGEPELVIPTLYMWLAGALADVKPQFLFTTTFGDITDRIDPEDIPEGVSVIKEYAFYHNRFKQVALPDSIEVVDKYAFYGNHDLEALDLGGVSSVGDYAFAFNVKLACVEARALTDISKYAFSNARILERINIPQIQSIGQNAFYQGNKLKGVHLPGTLRTLSSSAFGYCKDLRGVSFTTEVDSISASAFSGSSNINTICCPWSDGDVPGAPWAAVNAEVYYDHPCNYGWHVEDYIDDDGGVIQTLGTIRIYGTDGTMNFSSNSAQIWRSKKDQIQQLIVDEGITAIGDRSFAFFTMLERVSLPSTLKSIGQLAFNGTAISEVNIPAGVTDIGNGAFQGTPLKSVVLPGVSLGKIAFNNCHNLETVEFNGRPWYIEENAFQAAPLKRVSILARNAEAVNRMPFLEYYPWCASTSPSLRVTYKNLEWSFENGALVLFGHTIPSAEKGRENLQDWRRLGYVVRSVAFEDVTDVIGDRAFQGLANMKAVALPNHLRSIGAYAFDGCASIQEVLIPEGTEWIGMRAFQGCESLTNVRFLGRTLIPADAFLDCSKLSDIYVPWTEGALAGAPWGAINATIHYNVKEDE